MNRILLNQRQINENNLTLRQLVDFMCKKHNQGLKPFYDGDLKSVVEKKKIKKIEVIECFDITSFEIERCE